MSGQKWWIKDARARSIKKSESEITNSAHDMFDSLPILLGSEPEFQSNLSPNEDNVDIDSIIDEINRLSTQKSNNNSSHIDDSEERTIDDILQEVEQIYLETSKNFDQLSNRSKTSQSISDIFNTESNNTTPTPKSMSPLPFDDNVIKEDVNNKSDPIVNRTNNSDELNVQSSEHDNNPSVKDESYSSDFDSSRKSVHLTPDDKQLETVHNLDLDYKEKQEESVMKTELAARDFTIQSLMENNNKLTQDIHIIENQILDYKTMLQQASKLVGEDDVIVKLKTTIEELNNSKETNALLQQKFDSVNETHGLMKKSYDDLLLSNKNLEYRLVDMDTFMRKSKETFVAIQENNTELKIKERELGKQLEDERTRIKQIQIEKETDSKCIMDLNRQIKEMERIICRKQQDSVSDLLKSTRGVFANEVQSKVFLDVQQKFNEMKLKYENHIEDLELHVNDLKYQLKCRSDSYDVYTQTEVYYDEQIIPQRDSRNVAVQTTETIKKHQLTGRIMSKSNENKEKVVIRGLQTDLSNKTRVAKNMQDEIEELKKTNKRLQKEREGSLLEEKGACQKKKSSEIELKVFQMREDYQALKEKRLQDLSALQEAHEKELSTYLSNITPLREQLDVQQISLSALQSQLAATKEELNVVTVDRDVLNSRLQYGSALVVNNSVNGNHVELQGSMKAEITQLELKYEEREYRLRAIIHGLAQKNITNRNCQQCAVRQQQLIGYKLELDQLLATLRCIQ